MSIISKFFTPSLSSVILGLNRAIEKLDAVTEHRLAHIRQKNEAIAAANASIDSAELEVVRSVRVAEKLRELVA